MKKFMIPFFMLLMTHSVITGQEVARLNLNYRANVLPGSRITLPLQISTDSLITAIEFTLAYDSTMLAIIGHSAGKDLPDGFTIAIDTSDQYPPSQGLFRKTMSVSIIGDEHHSLSGKRIDVLNLAVRMLGLRGSTSLDFVPERVTVETANGNRYGGNDLSLFGAIFPIDEIVTTTVNLVTSSSQIIENDQFTVAVQIGKAYDLHSFNISITYDPQQLRVISVTEGPFLNENNAAATFWSPPVIDNVAGRVQRINGIRLSPFGINGSGSAAMINFRAISSGITSIKLNTANCKLQDSHKVDIGIKTFTDLEINAYRNPAARLSLPDTIGILNQQVHIPLTISNVQNSSIISGLFHVSCDTSVLLPLGVHTIGTIIENWQNPVSMTEGGTIKFALAGFSPLTMDGILAYITYRVNPNAREGDTTAIEFTHVMLNEGDPTFLTNNGRLEVDGLQLTGIVFYSGTDTPIPEVRLNLIGETTTTTYSNNEGRYSFSEIHYENYKLYPSHTANSGTCVTPFDAALLLQHIVRVTQLTPFQLIAANVSGDKTVSAFDASHILQYSVGLIDKFTISKNAQDLWRFIPTTFQITDNNWDTAPNELIYEPLTNDEFNQNFIGIIYGDVSQNWVPPTLTKPIADATAVSAGELYFGAITQTQEHYQIPIILDTDIAVASIELDIKFDPEQFMIISISAEDDFLSAFNIAENTIRIAMASARPQPHHGELATIRFSASKTMTNEIFCIDRAILNEDDVLLATGISQHDESVDQPGQFRLYQNYPNPFNSETNITFSIPEPDFVTLTVYAINGRPVRRLIHQRLDGRDHTIHWNGRDDNDVTVASGTYVIVLKSIRHHQARKIMYLK